MFITDEEVTLFRKDPLKSSLQESITSLDRKIVTIINGNRNKVQGDWCHGCNVECAFKKPGRWSNTSQPTLAEFGDFMKNINIVIPKFLNY